MTQERKIRTRDLGLPLEGTPGKYNAITDVAGVEVGYCTVIEGKGELKVGQGPVCTGVTAILPRGRSTDPRPAWAGQFDLNGNGEMTGSHWIRDAGYFNSPICITNTHSVGIAHHATVGWMCEQYKDYYHNHHSWAMPVIAETYDGMLNDICGRHVTEEHVLQALNTATSGRVAEGNVGGGTGMQSYEFKGGTGTSSRQIEIKGKQHIVAALVQSNFGIRSEFSVCGVPVGKHLTNNTIISDSTGHETGSIIVVIATDIPMLPVQLQRLAKRGALGIGRTGTSGGHSSGDMMLAFSTANDIYMPPLGAKQKYSFQLESINDNHCDSIFQAAVQAVEEAVLNAMIAAESVATIKPPGFILEAIDHAELCAVMKQHGRLNF